MLCPKDRGQDKDVSIWAFIYIQPITGSLYWDNREEKVRKDPEMVRSKQNHPYSETALLCIYKVTEQLRAILHVSLSLIDMLYYNIVNRSPCSQPHF